MTVWFFISGKPPQDLGILKKRLDLSYRATDHLASMHRALYINRPTTELSGDYKCLVSTFKEEDFMVKKMVVFGELKLSHFPHYDSCEELVTISDEASEVSEPARFRTVSHKLTATVKNCDDSLLL